MGRMCVGFAVLGATMALLSAALMSGIGQPSGMAVCTMVGSAGYHADLFAGDHTRYVVIAVVGAILGLIVGAVMCLSGFRVAGHPGNRIARITCAGMVGAVLGMSPTLVLLADAFDGYPSFDTAVPPLLLYGVSAVLGYALALGAVYLVLRTSHDPLAAATTRAVAFALPVGAILATAIGVLVAWAMGFSAAESTWLAVVILVLVTLVATFAVGRGWVLRTAPTA